MMDTIPNDQLEKKYLDLAARAASRAFGYAEPNPMVGAVIVKDDRIIGIGHHRRYGHLHAERDALKDCKEQGHDPHSSTLLCTLEPCCHHGKQPPCTQAIIDSGIERVVIASRDPHTLSGGGWEQLTNAGVEVSLSNHSANAIALSQPFLHRLAKNRPWVIAKWAQTIDGRIATRSGQSQWISGPRCRARVHRLRAKVDAVLIGVGTALADDPMLTPRDCRFVRRMPKRVVLDTHARLPLDSKLVQSAGEVPTIVYTQEPDRFQNTPVLAEKCPTRNGRADLHWALEHLLDQHKVATLLSESGPTLLGTLLEEDLINEAVVHLAPAVMGDGLAKPVATGRDVPQLDQMRKFTLQRAKPVGEDLEIHYRSIPARDQKTSPS